ncbi:hypothetical protein jhhlp_001502 [Lomentospora prolificans]|uniref:Signal recognition particle SRP19 subunit n=1 Tax=Lomentospora prolificans TaxID=41688 RepID=A0A2N3NIE3_9PEZI|nr:hypothetical protein jhhlp_001502 [Lomentospora prolificans]
MAKVPGCELIALSDLPPPPPPRRPTPNPKTRHSSNMSHPRVEEVSDSDLSDPSEGNISDFDESDILRVNAPKPTFAGSSSSSSAVAGSAMSAASRGPAPAASYQPNQPTQYAAATDAKKYASFQCLYPIYFSSRHSRQEGRRVSSSLAVPNPIARDIAHACSQLGLQVLFEPGKSHPRDWANPGRVKVKLRDPHRPVGAPDVNNKHHLYRLVAEWLRRHPTTDDSQSLRYQIPGVPVPKQGERWPRPAVPKGKGWKMNELLPFISPAMTGGGVSENLFKDMMKEMQGGGDPMSALMGAAGASGGAAEETGKKKKDKKGKGKA